MFVMFVSRFFVICVFLAVTSAAPTASDSVKVSLYYEGLCPYCHEFFIDQLYPGYQKLGDALTVELIPYGNAKRQLVDGKWEIICQHGENECYSNKVQACVLNQTISTSETLDFVKCLFEGQPNEQTAQQCSEEGQLDWATIKNCIDGDEGDQLLVSLGEKQDSLEVRVEYVPWILINDIRNEREEMQARADLVELVCGLLSQKPSACNETK